MRDGPNATKVAALDFAAVVYCTEAVDDNLASGARSQLWHSSLILGGTAKTAAAYAPAS